MDKPALLHELERILAVKAYDAIPIDPGQGFDRLTRLAGKILKVPVALVSLIDETRQEIKSCYGLSKPIEMSREIAFCSHTIARGEGMIVPDTRLDPRFSSHPYVTGWPHIRFYVGVPLKTPGGQIVGTLCGLDMQPRDAASVDLESLADLAALVIDEFEFRKAVCDLDHEHRSLLDAEGRFRGLAESIPGMVFETLQHDRTVLEYQYVSPGSSELFGISPEEILRDPLSIRRLIAPEDFGVALEEGDESLREGRPWRWEGRVTLANGQRKWIRGLARACEREGQHTRWRGIFLDITEIKEKEAAMIRAKEEAERANQAKSEFLSRISHELRTPLNSILGFTQLLELETTGPEAKEDLAEIRKSGIHLLGLINEVLDLSRVDAKPQPLDMESVSVSDVLTEVYGLLRPLMESRKTRLKAVHVSPKACACVDRLRLKQALINVVANAVKYNRVGGSVLVRLSTDTEGWVRVDVTDEGAGIPADRIDRLFTPFDRLGAEASGIEGTGLGLSIAKAFLSAMGGSIEVRSIETQGSTFTLKLPQAEPSECEGLVAA